MSPISPASSHRSVSPKATSAHDTPNGIRKRVRKACDRCRMKKTKCDGSSPCRRCRTDNVICCSKEGQKLRRRNFPKGYAEMLEMQHNQLVCGLQEMYQRLKKAGLWEDKPLDESSGLPLTHDILAALDILEPNEDGSDEDFIEPAETSSVQGNPEANVEKAPADPLQETLHSTPKMFATPALPAHTMPSTSPSLPTPIPGPQTIPEQPTLQPLDIQTPSRQLYSIVSSPMQLDGLWDDSLYCFDGSQMPSSSSSSLDNIDWSLQMPTLLPSLMTRMADLPDYDISSHGTTASAPRSSLGHNLFGDSVDLDSNVFMPDFYQVCPRDAAAFKLRLPKKAGRLS